MTDITELDDSCLVTGEIPGLNDGTVDVVVVTESIAPIEFITD